MIHAQIHISLGIHEGGVEIVSPCWNANKCRVVGPFRLATLEEELSKYLRDLIIWRVQIARAEWVSGFDGGDEGCSAAASAKIGLEECRRVVLSDGEDTMPTLAFFHEGQLARLTVLLVRSFHPSQG